MLRNPSGPLWTAISSGPSPPARRSASAAFKSRFLRARESRGSSPEATRPDSPVTVTSKPSRAGSCAARAKSSSSAAKWLTIHQFTDAQECFAALRRNYKLILTTHLSSDAVSLHSINFTQPIALVFGNEHSGVSDEIRALADGNFIIPQTGIIKSLNISVACAVTLYEALRQKTAAGHYEKRRLDQDRFGKLLHEWGFLDAEASGIITEKNSEE
jgi:tRNA(Leu) C34 or U34 (ribose-2'-O)-methylase TrmL